jgi:ribosomal protein L29
MTDQTPLPPADKRARAMTPEEYKARLAELRRGPPPQPVTLPEQRHARDMTPEEREAKLNELKRLAR